MALKTPIVRDGDAGFVGFASRMNPLTLAPGLLQECRNMRLHRGGALTRRGALRVATEINTADEPLTLSFDLAEDVEIAGITFSGETAVATTAAPHGYNTGKVVNVAGATGPDAVFYNGDFTVTVLGETEFEYTMTGTPGNDASGTLVANAGPIVKESYDGGIFAAGVFASRAYENAQEYVVLCGPDAAYLWRQGSAPVTKGYPAPELVEPSDEVSCVQAYDRFYILREADRTRAGWSEQLTAGAGITVAGTTATVNVDAHGYEAGMRVRIEGSTVSAFDGHEYDVATAAADSFTVVVPGGTSPAAVAGIRVRRVKPPLYWDGGTGGFVRAPAGVPSAGPTYERMRSCGWAGYVNNRLVIPAGRDGLLLSDVLDADTYDPFWQSARAGAGGNDHVVGAHPWVDGALLGFCRKSLWLLGIESRNTLGGTGSVISHMDLLTDEIGCVARRTICTAGQYVFFLSDAGVYRLDARLDLKLRGDTRPLSEPVADWFARIDRTRAARACAVWHDNRFVIAIPVLGLPGDDDTNNLVLAWNALNEQWEYADNYPVGVDDLVVSEYDGARRIFAVRRTGSLFLLDEKEDATDDEPAGTHTAGVTGRIVTRRYAFGSMHRKRFVRAMVDAVLQPGSTATVRCNLTNPDRSVILLPPKTNESAEEEDFTLKHALRQTAHYAELVMETTGGRGEFRACAVEAAVPQEEQALTRAAQ